MTPDTDPDGEERKVPVTVPDQVAENQRAIETARNFASLMETAAFAGPVRGEDSAARKVEWYLTRTPYWGGPPPTLEEAQKAARRAWGDKIPEEVAEALSLT